MTKREWMADLKVGDTVCDCRFKHLRIAEIRENRWKVLPYWMLWVCLTLPEWVGDRLEKLLLKAFGKEKLHDKELILEDGASCSALHCCDPVRHVWDHPIIGMHNDEEGGEPPETMFGS